jgi:hypothetical protein
MKAAVSRCLRTALLLATLVAAAGIGCHDRSPPAVASQDAEVPAVTESTVVAPPPHAEPSQSLPVLEVVGAGSEHPNPQPSAACLAKAAGHDTKPAGAIHRWIDSSGVTHYSDQAPTMPVSEHRVLEVHGLPPVEVEATGYDVNLPADLQRRAVVDALAVQHVFHDALGIDAPSDMVLKVVFVSDANAYGKLIGDSALAASTGAYVPQQHAIYVRMQSDDELAFSILRHEITHALIHEQVGNLPVTLNEGLAEYFRRYRVAGMGGQIDIGADRSALISAAPTGDGSDALVELLALSGPDFYAAERDRRYLQAYALVAVLMRGSAETAALHEVLIRQRADPCVPVQAEKILDDRYPGGLGKLAGDWAALLREPPISVRTY